MLPDAYYPAPLSLPSLPPALRRGLVPVSLLALLSIGLVCSALACILWRHPWRAHHRARTLSGQYVVLITNLLIADLLQSAAMSIGLHWLRIDAILAPTFTCFLQGWLLHMGDVSSAIFVFFIALHTFAALSIDYRIRNVTLYRIVAAGWALGLLLTVIGVLMHGKHYFVHAGAWCWVSERYETSRLFLHYFWLFIVQLSTWGLYMATMSLLIRRAKRAALKLSESTQLSTGSSSHMTGARLVRIIVVMTAYPLIYLLLTLPVCIGRMRAMAGDRYAFTDTYACVVGGALASCGAADSLLYILTRRRIFDERASEISVANSPSAVSSTAE